MKTTGIVRNIDALGRFVIPKEMCRNLKINPGDPVEIFMEGKRVILQKHENSCIFCSNTDHLETYEGRLICPKCIQNLKNL